MQQSEAKGSSLVVESGKKNLEDQQEKDSILIPKEKEQILEAHQRLIDDMEERYEDQIAEMQKGH